MNHSEIVSLLGSFFKLYPILKEIGIPNVSVSPTLLIDNYFQIDKIIKLALDHGADEVQVVQLCSTGRAKNLSSLTLEQFKEARQLVQKSLSCYPRKHITATEGILRKQCEVCVSNKTAVPSFIGCSGGRTCMAINEVGKVFPCILYRKLAGDFRRNTFIDIWQHSSLFNSIREIKGECVNCSYADKCARECPLTKDKLSEQGRKNFSQGIKECSINKKGCDKFVGENLCFIRF